MNRRTISYQHFRETYQYILSHFEYRAYGNYVHPVNGNMWSITSHSIAIWDKDDYFTIIMMYPKHRITLTSGMVFMQQLPAYKIYGTKGCFIKYRADVQEDDLLTGKKPGTAQWGEEP